jgi:hypothetical protein
VTSAQLTVTELMVPAGLTFTIAVEDLLASSTEVAVAMIWVFVGTMGAVSSPELEIEPEVTLHVTVGSKLPVPVTMAVH